MKIRLSTKLFIVGFAVVIIAIMSVSLYMIKNTPDTFLNYPTDNNSTITIEKYEITEDEISE